MMGRLDGRRKLKAEVLFEGLLYLKMFHLLNMIEDLTFLRVK